MGSSITKLGMRSVDDANNTAPSFVASKNDYVEWSGWATAGTSQDPKLVVTFSVARAPTGLQVEPRFSGVFRTASTTALATSYRLQIATSSSYWGAPYWDSGKQTLSSSTPKDQRSPWVSSTTTFSGGQSYYWRLKFWDQTDGEGIWSTTTPLFQITN